MSYSYHIKLSCAPRAPCQVDPPNHSIFLADSIHEDDDDKEEGEISDEKSVNEVDSDIKFESNN